MEPGSKHSDDGEDVFSEFLLVGDRRGVGVNDDGCAVLVEDVFDEIECESTESVLVGDVDSSKSSLECESEDASEPLALEVEATCNVTEDSCVRVGDSEAGELSFEIRCLLAGADPSVDDVDALCLVHIALSDSCVAGRGIVVGIGDGRDGRGDVVECLSTPSRAHALDVSFISPLSQSPSVDAKNRLSLLGLDKFRTHATAAGSWRLYLLVRVLHKTSASGESDRIAKSFSS